MPAKILIVEDEAVVAMEIALILESLGYQVVGQARNGDKALDLLANRAVDLALLDISIKGSLNGIDLARIIQDKYDFPHVFLTAHADSHTLDAVKSTLPYGYIVKPFTENDLRSAIELALYRFNADRQPAFPERSQLESRLSLQLTDREYELYALLFIGKSYKEMATSCSISVNTVKLHLKNLFSKLEVNSRHKACQLLIG